MPNALSASVPRMRRLRSVPAVMLPHWSLPPICAVTPYVRLKWTKSYPCSSWYENSVKLIPSPSSRVFTLSLLSMVPMRANLPTSRRNSRKPIPANHSRLLRSMPGTGASRCVSSARRMASMPLLFASMVASSITGRSALLPEGSPTRAVAPPSRATGVWPHFWNHTSTKMPSRLPRWRLSAVGSNPQYTLIGPAPVALRSSSSLVMASTSPRSFSTSTMLRPSIVVAAEGTAVVSIAEDASCEWNRRPAPCIVQWEGAP
mmetsp:Transcript_15812/g.26695  ORF Transcript_15812/g.26695 Transcript_15812/m.26695 type:complete len:260 (+) Transcript_15812:199-978(+)